MPLIWSAGRTRCSSMLKLLIHLLKVLYEFIRIYAQASHSTVSMSYSSYVSGQVPLEKLFKIARRDLLCHAQFS